MESTRVESTRSLMSVPNRNRNRDQKPSISAPNIISARMYGTTRTCPSPKRASLSDNHVLGRAHKAFGAKPPFPIHLRQSSRRIHRDSHHHSYFESPMQYRIVLQEMRILPG